MKRSTGVTVLSILLIIAGAYGVFGSFMGLAMTQVMPVFQEQMIHAIEEDMADKAGPRTEEFNKTSLEFMEKMFNFQKEFMRSTWMIFFMIFQGLQGAAAAAGGIGLLLLKRWGYSLILGYAWVSLFVDTVLGFSGFRVVRESIELFESFPEPMPAGFEKMIQVMVPIQIIFTILLVLVWFGFIIWFLNRDSIKAQFESAPISTA